MPLSPEDLVRFRVEPDGRLAHGTVDELVRLRESLAWTISVIDHELPPFPAAAGDDGEAMSQASFASNMREARVLAAKAAAPVAPVPAKPRDPSAVIEAARVLHDAFLRVGHDTLATTMNTQWARLNGALKTFDAHEHFKGCLTAVADRWQCKSRGCQILHSDPAKCMVTHGGRACRHVGEHERHDFDVVDEGAAKGIDDHALAGMLEYMANVVDRGLSPVEDEELSRNVREARSRARWLRERAEGRRA